eukprot:s6082_g3.t1
MHPRPIVQVVKCQAPQRSQGPKSPLPKHSSPLIQTLIVPMSLSKRLCELRTGAYADPMEEFKQLPFETLCHMKVDFGKAHAGKSYLEMWHQEPGWVKWVVKTYEGSGKIEHKKFLWFVELMVGMEEKGMTPSAVLEEHTRVATQMPVAKAKARFQNVPRASHEAMAEMAAQDALAEMGETEAEEWINMVGDSQNEVIDALQARMLNVEGALTEILQHIRQEK